MFSNILVWIEGKNEDLNVLADHQLLMNAKDDKSDSSVLVISEHTNPDKIERHVGPLAAITNQVTVVCLTPNNDVDVRYIQVSSFGSRLLGIGLLLVAALREAISNDYDIVVSFSLFPYGLYALVTGWKTQTPTHLGILGADLDVHADAWYGWITQTAFRKFDSISVLGSNHRTQLAEYGVPTDDIFVLTNAIDTNTYHPDTVEMKTKYNFVWSGRFAPEKDPLLFINAIKELRSRGHDVRGVMLGTGGLHENATKLLEKEGLSDVIDMPGWVDEPAEYYAVSDVFVLTSKREALGLSLVESMAMGLPCITPRVGNIPDIATDSENVIFIDRRTPDSVADAMEQLLTDDSLREKLGSNAVSVGQSFSYENAQQDWERIVSHTVS